MTQYHGRNDRSGMSMGLMAGFMAMAYMTDETVFDSIKPEPELKADPAPLTEHAKVRIEKARLKRERKNRKRLETSNCRLIHNG